MRSLLQKILFSSFFLIDFIFVKDVYAQQIYLRSLRVDPSYFYTQYSGMSPNAIAIDLVAKAKAGGANALFIYAYNTIYGAYYPTSYPNTAVENGYGQLNILKVLTDTARKNNLKVIAAIPINNFKHAWQDHANWRAKKISGEDYIPAENAYLLSAWHPDFRTWLNGFIADLIAKNPNISGVEATEPYIDYYWNLETDYNPVANQIFKSKYRRAKLGSATWLKFRAQGLTDLIGIMNNITFNSGKESFVVQTWPAQYDGSLFSSQVIRDYVGLDLDGILNLTGRKKLKYLSSELIWQHWASEYGPANFSPLWTRDVAQIFINFVNSRSTPVIHVELSPFTGSYGTVTPSLQEFIDTLISIKDLNAGIDVYDHRQVFDLNAWDALLNWN